MNALLKSFPTIEPLESRIAPATLAGTTALNENGFLAVTLGSPQILHAGQGLSTSGPFGGSYLLYVKAGTAEVFTTDLNHNNKFDANEITGIAAGDGLQLILFTDVHGDIVTNLDANGKLSDSDNDASNGLDGRRLLNSHIDSIELRSVTDADLTENDPAHPNNNPTNRLALSSYSIFGNIYAGGGFGKTDGTGGLLIDTSGADLQASTFSDPGVNHFVAADPTIGSIKVGTAASGQHFSFGVSANGQVKTGNLSGDVYGAIVPFVPQAGQAGADIIGVKTADAQTQFNIDTLQAGDGGFGGRGGSIVNVTLGGDTAGGYNIIAGNGGRGLIGGTGGSILNFSDLSSVTGKILLLSGNGGLGLTGSGGAAGQITFGKMNAAGQLSVQLGDGGGGFTNGGAGGGLGKAIFTTPTVSPAGAVTVVTTTRDLDPLLVNPNTPGNYVNSEVPAQFFAAVPTIGKSQAIDFDHDGFGDGVFAVTNPDQVLVLFGNGTGFDSPRTISLNVGAKPTNIVVADFNNDGHPDIAVASSGANSFAGISVFLSKYVDSDNNGSLDKFVGFSDPLQTTLPSLTGLNLSVTSVTYANSATPVTNLVAGDFNGDGIMDLGVQATYQKLHNGTVVSQPVLLFMDGQKDATGTGSGYFLANFGTGVGPTIKPFLDVKPDNSNYVDPSGVLKASALASNGSFDVLFSAALGAKSVNIFDNHTQPTDGSGPVVTSAGLGKVDIDREPHPAGDPDPTKHITLSDAFTVDFATVDIDHDGNTDLIVLSATNGANKTGSFLITFQGGASGFTKSSDPNSGAGRSDQSGISISERDPAPNPPGGDVKFATSPTNIIGVDADGDGQVDDVALQAGELK